MKANGLLEKIRRFCIAAVIRRRTEWEKFPETKKQRFYDMASEVLQDFYSCTRVWEAWSYGTMSRDDFKLANEDDEILEDTARYLYEKVCAFL